MQKKFWNDKKVLITGASGFIGRHLLRYLKTQGAQVIGLDKESSNTEGIISCNLENKHALDTIFQRYSFFACYHLAAIAIVEKGQEIPYQTLKSNLLSTLNILELCRLKNVQRIIIASTSHVYGDAPIPTSEDEPPRPSRPYETSKTCTDLIAQSYADTFSLPVLIPRFVNIYGPGDRNITRLIPKTIMNILIKNKVTMWGGNALREYLYIDDAIHAYDLLAQISDKNLGNNRIYNFGTGKLVSVKTVIDTIISLSQRKVRISKILAGRNDELPVQQVSWDKASRVLDWHPMIELSDGLAKTIDWYRQKVNNKTI